MLDKYVSRMGSIGCDYSGRGLAVRRKNGSVLCPRLFVSTEILLLTFPPHGVGAELWLRTQIDAIDGSSLVTARTINANLDYLR